MKFKTHKKDKHFTLVVHKNKLEKILNKLEKKFNAQKSIKYNRNIIKECFKNKQEFINEFINDCRDVIDKFRSQLISKKCITHCMINRESLDFLYNNSHIHYFNNIFKNIRVLTTKNGKVYESGRIITCKNVKYGYFDIKSIYDINSIYNDIKDKDILEYIFCAILYNNCISYKILSYKY